MTELRRGVRIISNGDDKMVVELTGETTLAEALGLISFGEIYVRMEFVNIADAAQREAVEPVTP